MKHRRLDLGLPPLARLGVHVAFTTLFRRFPELRSAVISEEMRWGSSFLRRVCTTTGTVLTWCSPTGRFA
jgi:hypothetical protein